MLLGVSISQVRFNIKEINNLLKRNGLFIPRILLCKHNPYFLKINILCFEKIAENKEEILSFLSYLKKSKIFFKLF